MVQDKHTVVPKKNEKNHKQSCAEKGDRNATMNTSLEDATEHLPQAVKLPQIQLPKFDDKITEWIAFRHMSPYQCSYSKILQDTGIRTKTIQ